MQLIKEMPAYVLIRNWAIWPFELHFASVTSNTSAAAIRNKMTVSESVDCSEEDAHIAQAKTPDASVGLVQLVLVGRPSRGSSSSDRAARHAMRESTESGADDAHITWAAARAGDGCFAKWYSKWWDWALGKSFSRRASSASSITSSYSPIATVRWSGFLWPRVFRDSSYKQSSDRISDSAPRSEHGEYILKKMVITTPSEQISSS